MGNNPQLIKRDGSTLAIYLKETVATTEDEMVKLRKEGYHDFKIFGEKDEVILHRRSKTVDGYVRSTDAVWHKDIEIFPYEKDQLAWAAMVNWWFENAIKDEEYMALINDMYGKFIDVGATMRKAQVHQAALRPKRAGKAGARRGDLHRWLINSKGSYFSKAARNRG